MAIIGRKQVALSETPRRLVLQVVPCDEQKATDQSQVLEERIRCHEAFRRCHPPEAVGDECGHQRLTRRLIWCCPAAYLVAEPTSFAF